MIREYIMEPFHSELRVSKVFGLPKVHKKGDTLRMRLVFLFNHHPWGPLHKFLAKALEPAVLRVQTVISNVMEVVDAISGKNFPKGTLFCSADIATMYPSIDRRMALQVARGVLDAEEFRCFRGHDDLAWRHLLEIAHTYLEFTHGDKIYLQHKGVPIGSPAAPQLAILALHTLIASKWASLIMPNVYFAGFYFDDALVVFKPGQSKNSAKEMLNSILLNTTLSFDPESFDCRFIEELEIRQFPFLDIAIGSSSSLLTPDIMKCWVKVFCKPMGAYQYVPWRSAHPPSVKRGLIRSELRRRLRLTDREYDWAETVDDLMVKLSARGYPRKVLNAEVEKLSFAEGKDLRERLIQKLRKRRSTARFPFGHKSVENDGPLTAIIPLITRYDPSALRIVKKRRRELNDAANELLDRTSSQLKKVRLVNAFTMGRSLLSLVRNPT